MADPTTLVEYAQGQLTSADDERSIAQTLLKTTQGRAVAARASLARAIANLKALQQDEAELRKQLPSIPTAGDGNALVNELELTIIAEREAQAEVLDAATALAIAEADQTRAAATLARTQQAVGEAQSRLQNAQERSKRVADAKDVLSKKPLSALHDEAADAKNADPFKDAQKRIEADFPPGDALGLLTYARSRLRQVNDELDAASLAQSDADKKAMDARVAAGLVPESAPLWAELRNADDIVASYVATAQERFDRAMAILKRIPDAAPLTDAERQRISALAAAAKAQTDNETKVLDLTTSATSVNTLTKTLQQRRLEAIAKDIDPEPFVGLRKDLRQAQASLQAAEDVVTTAQQDVDDAIATATTNGVADPETDPAVVQKRSQLVQVTKARDDAKNEVAHAQTLLDDAKVAAGADAAIDALITADDALEQAKAKVAAQATSWNAKEQNLRDATQTLRRAQDKVAEAIRAARAKNVDPTADGDVQAAQLAETAAQTALKDAEQKYRDDGKGKLHVWEAAIPDGEWKLLADFEEAQVLLDALATDPAPMITAQTDAEKALVAALVAADGRERQAVLLEGEAQARTAQLEALAHDREARLLAALRGDR